jgi:hypothetical protein
MSPLLLALALAALHPELRPTGEVSDSYVCELERTLPSGRLTVLVSGPTDASETYYRPSWSSARDEGGPGPNLGWFGLSAPADDERVSIYFIVPHGVGDGRVEVRGGRGDAAPLAGVNGFGSVEGGGWAYSGMFEWGALVRLVRAHDGAVAVLAPAAGSGRIDVAMIDAPAAALAAARGEIERIARERRCGPEERLSF